MIAVRETGPLGSARGQTYRSNSSNVLGAAQRSSKYTRFPLCLACFAVLDVVYYEDATIEDALEFLGAEKEEEKSAVRETRKARNRQSAQRSRQACYLHRVNLSAENEKLEQIAALAAAEHEEVSARLERLRLRVANKKIELKRQVKSRMLAMSSEADLGGGKKMM